MEVTFFGTSAGLPTKEKYTSNRLKFRTIFQFHMAFRRW